MSRQVVEHGGIPVGIAVPHDGGLRFIAVKFHVIDLDNGIYRSISDLHASIRRHLSSGHAVAA